jgi:ATP-dependent DNA helicase PIF1
LGTVDKVSKVSVIVKADKGGIIEVPFAEHELNDGDGSVLVKYTQLPLDLAWAMTIHKSQGTTVEKIGIQLENHFGPGMTYVALSRCKSPDNVFVTGDLVKALADPRVVQLYRSYYGV